MDPGRKVDTYTAYGRQCVRPIGKSWTGPAEQPIAATRLPVLVHDEKFRQPQQLRPHEAERLMGMSPGCTAGASVTAKQRLRCIGNGWDMRVVTMLLRHSKMTGKATPALTAMTNTTEVGALLHLHQQGDAKSICTLIASQPLELQLQLLSTLQEWEHNAILSVSDRHSVLDSGSSRHLHTQTLVTDPDDRVPLTGFDNSNQWTAGNGYLPCSFSDDRTDKEVLLDINDVDYMEGLSSDILSMGKLLRLGFDFHFTENGRQCFMLTPGGGHRVLVELGSDDIIRIPHVIRKGPSGKPLPQPLNAVNAVRRGLPASIDADYLHHVFNHTTAEKIYQTLKATKGFKAVRLPPYNCSSCATGNARRRGLSHAVGHLIAGAADAVLEEAVYGDGNDDSAWDDEGDGMSAGSDVPQTQYRAAVAGRELGVQRVPRFDLQSLRPFEVMFADN